MQFVATDGFWHDDGTDELSASVVSLMNRPPEGIEIELVNAGFGADWPALVWRCAQGAAVALTIAGAPSAIEENWPRWKTLFDEVRDRVSEFHQSFSIDGHSATVIAIKHAVTTAPLQPPDLRIDFAIRHFNQRPESSHEDIMLDQPTRVENTAAGNLEACKYTNCRYIFGISDHRRAITVIVERDGTVSYCAQL